MITPLRAFWIADFRTDVKNSSRVMLDGFTLSRVCKVKSGSEVLTDNEEVGLVRGVAKVYPVSLENPIRLVRAVTT